MYFIKFDINQICSGVKTVRDADEENTKNKDRNGSESDIFNKNGVVNLDELERYCDLVKQVIYDKGILEEDMGIVIMGYVLCNKRKALNLFKKNYDYLEGIHCSESHFEFSAAAVNLFKQIDDTKPYHMKINKKFALYQEDDTYDVKKLIDYYNNIARSIAQKFDERNGTDYYMKRYQLLISFH